MGVNSDFGIKTAVDNSGIDSLIDRLTKMLDIVKTVEKQFGSVFDGVSKGAQKMSQSFVDADGKITQSRQESSDRQAALLAAQVAKQEAAAAKIAAAQEAKNAKIAAAQDAENAKRQAKAQALSRAMQAYEADDAEAVKRFAELKAQYENKSTDEIRAKIHEMNTAVREERVKLANTVRTLTQEGDKEAAAAAKNEYQTRINVDEKELQQFRLLEQERVGRTFAEIQERIHAEGTGNKEIIAMLETSAAKEEEIQKKITVTFEAEEKKRLQAALNEAKQETAAIKQEAEHRNINVSAHAEAHSEGIGLPQIAMLGAATEGLSALVEKSKEVTDENKGMSVSFGDGAAKAQEEAERIGASMGKTKDETGTLMAKIHAATGAQGEELEKYTRALIAAQDAGIQISAKSLQTQAGMQKLLAEGMPLVANAMKTAQEPAQQAALAQKDVEESAGELANTLLTGLAPVITDLTPLIGTVGEIASSVLSPALKLVSIVLAPVMEGLKFLKPILPELAIGAGILAVALNATAIATWAVNAAMAVNPFVWIALAVIALIGGIVLLVKHWKEVIEWFKKAAETVMNAGGALLSLLGITGKAEAATKKHTDAVKENKKSLDEQKKSVADVTKAYQDYSASLEENQDAQKKLTDQSEKDAEANIVDIREKLKTASGDEKAALEERLQQNIAAGKAAVAAQKQTAKELHEAQLATGAAEPEKKAKAKKGTSPEEIAKAEADRVLAVAKDSDAKLTETDAEHKAAELLAEQAHAQKLLDIAKKYHTENSKDVADADLNLRAIQKQIFDATQGEQQDSMVTAFQAMQAKHEAMEKEALDVREKARVDGIQDEFEKARAEEEDRYSEELEKRKDDIYKADGTLNALGEALAANHQGKVTAITQQGADKQNQIWLQQAQYLSGPISNAFNNAFKGMTKGLDTWTDNLAKSNNFAQSFFGSLLQGFTQMVEGLIIKFVEFEAAFEVLNLITGGGAAAIMGAFNVAGALGIPGHAEGTDNSPGGWHYVGEKGPELLNMHPGAQVIPNHRLNQANASVDLSPLLSKLDAIHSGIQQSNRTFQGRPAPVFPVNDNARQIFNQSVNAEARRSA